MYGENCKYGNDMNFNTALASNIGTMKNLLPRSSNMTANSKCDQHTLLYVDPNIHYTESGVPFNHICFPNLSDRALGSDSNKSIPRLIEETHEYLVNLSMRHRRLKADHESAASDSE